MNAAPVFWGYTWFLFHPRSDNKGTLSAAAAAEGDSIRRRSHLPGSTFHRHHWRLTERRLVKCHQRLRIILTFYAPQKETLLIYILTGCSFAEVFDETLPCQVTLCPLLLKKGYYFS